MKALKKIKSLILLPLLILFFNCNDDSNSVSNTDSEMARFSIKLVDAPGDYDKVFVDVIDIRIKMNDDSDGEDGWMSVPTNAGQYDLLELTGGESAVLVDDYEVLAGELSQIRLVLGDNNYVVNGDEEFELKTPSAQQSGLKLKVNQELEAGYLYSFVLDFNVAESIVDAGNSGNIILKPVINTSLEAASGIIEGAISPSDFQTEVSVMVGEETIISYATPENGGVFMLYGVPEGTYDLTITPDAESNYAGQVISVDVVNGQITNVGTIELELLPGSITGTILNEGLAVEASVMVDGEEVTASTDESGVFLLENLPVGMYTVTLTPDEGSGLSPTEIMDVEVMANQTTDLGEITLE
ncbi:MAG TPA: DUF4382 domain-containing protein [Flavobacteriaceae bacterium]|nr:DUF4382 domain-containing protein [Flavobacteriaceae bacterium]